MMFKKLEIWGDDGKDGNEETVIHTFDDVNVCWDTKMVATARNRNGDVVATMKTFDDYPITVSEHSMEIDGLAFPAYDDTKSERSPYGYWKCYQ